MDAWLIRCNLLLTVLQFVIIKDSVGTNVVKIDLRFGIVRGYSPYISFVQSPSSVSSTDCTSQAVIKIDFSGVYDSAKFFLEYGESPKLWTLDISDSPHGDGHGGDGGFSSNMAEMQIHNRQLGIYSNKLPGYLDVTKDGGLLIKSIDNVVKKGSNVNIEVSDERIEFDSGQYSDLLESKYLYTLSGQNAQYGEKDGDLFVGFNRVVAGSHRNGSGLCHAVISLHQITGGDACEKGTHNCHKDAICENSRRSYNCKCKPGFYGNGKICIDTDECEYGNDCVHFCQNSIGNYSCSCLSGFQLDRDGHNCIDVNECFSNRGSCQHQCVNTLGSYECKCNSGYTLTKDGRSCQLGRWCVERRGCQHHCESAARGVRCACRQNYVLHTNGKTCIPTCAVGNGGCQHKCKNTPKGPVCSCAEKYMLRDDLKTCIATCDISNGGCDRKCNNTEEGPICSCPVGYALHQDGKTCLDIDECVKNNGGCSHECVNTHGGFECLCPEGFAVRGGRLKCTDIDECSLNRTCDHVCINTPGKYHCECNDGYQLYGKTHCADVNECLVNNGGCQHSCKNIEGGHECTCRSGYKLHQNRKDCVVANRCSQLASPSKATLSCFRHGSEERCNLKCHKNAYFITDVENYTVTCGPKTRYIWSHELNNSTLHSCSETAQPPFLKRRAKFVFVAQKCKVRRSILRELQKNLTNTLNGHKRYQCSSHCKVIFVGLHCGSNRRRFRRLIKGREDHELITAEIEIQRSPVKFKTSRKCNVECLRNKTEKKLKKTIKKLRKSVNKEKFFVKYEDNVVEVAKKSFKPEKTVLMSCGPGTVLVSGKCIFCSIGTYFDGKTKFCMPCKSGTYQDVEGKLSCKKCPRSVRGAGINGARNISECSVLCDPGTYSDNGFKPCQQCDRGYYQVDYGRTSCMPCGAALTTKKMGSTGFQDCQTPVSCKPGTYYEIHNHTCISCKIGTYQPRERQNYCLPCPGSTLTDFLASTQSSQCKNRKCGGYVGKFQGILESPNYPGDYPNDISCVWKIKPGKGRRILVIVPEMFLRPEDKCGDTLVMRKSRSPYSQTTYESCETTETPRAFTARSRKLWIRFKSNGNNTASGFSIPFVTYDENYHDLIEDIVSDGRLYSSLQHQSILKDRKLLTTLMEVIENPTSYFKYANMSKTMFPKSFIRLLTNKVRRFFEN